MGLTHYWYRPTELPAAAFAAAVNDIQLVLRASGVPLGGYDGTGEPILRDDVIVFNGARGAAVEPFEMHPVEFDRRGSAETFSYCKTEGASYDLAVRAALIVFAKHLGAHIRIMSDDPDETWEPARALVERVVGYGREFNLTPKA